MSKKNLHVEDAKLPNCKAPCSLILWSPTQPWTALYGLLREEQATLSESLLPWPLFQELKWYPRQYLTMLFLLKWRSEKLKWRFREH